MWEKIATGVGRKLNLRRRRREIVRRTLAILGTIVLAISTALGAQDSASTGAKKSKGRAVAGSPARGKTVFDQKCAICHFADSDQKKIGPGLKGIAKRGTFTVNGSKVTTDSLTKWIETGDALMPGMKETLEPEQIRDVVAYVKTL